jgi:hypothetical protein
MDGIQKEVMPEQNWQTWKKRSFPAGGIAWGKAPGMEEYTVHQGQRSDLVLLDYSGRDRWWGREGEMSQIMETLGSHEGAWIQGSLKGLKWENDMVKLASYLWKSINYIELILSSVGWGCRFRHRSNDK